MSSTVIKDLLLHNLHSQCHAAPQITVFHLNLALYKFWRYIP